MYDQQAKERQKRKPTSSVPVNLPEQNHTDARDAAGKAFGVSGKSVEYATKVLATATRRLGEILRETPKMGTQHSRGGGSKGSKREPLPDAPPTLADGFHRVKAMLAGGFVHCDAIVHQGDQADAQWFSYSANRAHDTAGLKRTNADKHRAVQAALRTHGNYADSAIADRVGVSHTMVANHRAMTCNGFKSHERTGRDGRTINTANIGRKPQTASLQQFPRLDPQDVRDLLQRGHGDTMIAAALNPIPLLLASQARTQGRLILAQAELHPQRFDPVQVQRHDTSIGHRDLTFGKSLHHALTG